MSTRLDRCALESQPTWLKLTVLFALGLFERIDFGGAQVGKTRTSYSAEFRGVHSRVGRVVSWMSKYSSWGFAGAGAVAGGPDPIVPWAAAQLRADRVDWLARLPHSVMLNVEGFGDVVFCYGTPTMTTKSSSSTPA